LFIENLTSILTGCSSLNPPTDSDVEYRYEEENGTGNFNSTDAKNLGWYILYYAMHGVGVFLGGSP